MAVVAVLATIYGLKQVVQDGLDFLPAGCIVAGLAVGVGSVCRQRTLADPVVDVGLFRITAFRAALAVNLLAIFVTIGWSRIELADRLPAAIPAEAAAAARDTLGGAVAVASQLPDPLGAVVLQVAREAFVQGMQLSAVIAAVVAVGLAILVVVTLSSQPAASADVHAEAEVARATVTPAGSGSRDTVGDKHGFVTKDVPPERRVIMMNRRALIVGGGIGGPVAAMALKRARIEATVYEAAGAPADYVGLFLNTSSNGLDVLRTLDIDAAGRADGFAIPRSVMWSGTGRRLGEVANGIRLHDGTVSVALRRGLLQGVLREEAERAASGSSSASGWTPTRPPTAG
jgi:hypothetical protein